MRRRFAELAFIAAGVCLLGRSGWNLLAYSAFQTHPEWFAPSLPPLDGGASTLLPISVHGSNSLRNLNDLQVLGKLEVPRLRMSVLVVEGDDEKKLALAAGHLTGTAPIGTKGNSVIAGHRDSAFWPLRKIKTGDRIRVRTDRTYDYVVRTVRVVGPEDVSVLRASEEHELTLVTCYPFRHVGSAPERFIVQAVSTSR